MQDQWEAHNYYLLAARHLKHRRGIDPEAFAPYLPDLAYSGYDQRLHYGFCVPNIASGFEARRTGR